MAEYFDICGTHIPISAIKDFRIIDVEFIFRPVFHEIKKTMLSAFSSKKFEYDSLQPYASIIGQQGHKSALGEYKAKDFKEALGKDLSSAVIYTVADKLKLKAFKYQKYQCLNLAGRAFTTYLDDVPIMLKWNDGRIAEVYKEDPLYTTLTESTTPGIQYVPALIIKAQETFCFYGNGIQIDDTSFEFERLKEAICNTTVTTTSRKSLFSAEKLALPQIPKFQLPVKSASYEKDNVIDIVVEQEHQ